MPLLDPQDYRVNPGQMQATVPAPQQSAQPPVSSALLDGLFAAKAPHEMDNSDRWGVLGATLRDIGAQLRDKPAVALEQEREIQAQQSGQPVMAPAKGTAKGGIPAVGKAAKGAPTDSALLYQVAKNLFPGDPKAQYLFASGNSDFLGKISDPYGFHAVTGGDTVYGAPGTTGPTVAPKLVDHEGQYGTQGASGYQGTGTAAPSYADVTGQRNADTEAQKAVEQGRHNTAEEGQGRTRLNIEGDQLGVAQQHLGLERQQFGHASNPTAPVVYSQGDYDKLPSGQHLQYVAPDGSLRIKP